MQMPDNANYCIPTSRAPSAFEMKNLKRVAAAFLWLASGVLLRSQTVILDSNGRRYPLPSSAEECAPWEPLKPNLVLSSDTVVHGTLRDQTKAPFSNSPIRLRKYISETKQVPIKTVQTDAQGGFDLGIVKAGDYRLLLSPHRGFAQPEKLECLASECKLNVTLVVNPTDLVTANCPIR
jgi:hypothetical protein